MHDTLAPRAAGIDDHSSTRADYVGRAHLTNCFAARWEPGVPECIVRELLEWFKAHGVGMAPVPPDDLEGYALGTFVWDDRRRRGAVSGLAAKAEVHWDGDCDEDWEKTLHVVIHDPQLATLYKLTWG